MADPEIAVRLVDSLNAGYGVHPDHRAAHAKGVLCAATFEATPVARDLSTAQHFAGGPVRCHVRFSNGSGDPGQPDTIRDGRGMAVKFYLADGTTTDIVALSLPAFFVRTPEELLEFNEARRVDPVTGQPDMGKVGAFLADHPETMTAVNAALSHPHPEAHGTLVYNGVHAFGFVNANGERRYGRYHLVPVDGESFITDEEAAARAPDYLTERLSERLEDGVVRYDLMVELAAEGDPVDDPTSVWPELREQVNVGRLTITGLAFDREQGDDVLVFDPTRVTGGIELTDDPILHARRDAYSESVRRRTGG